MPHKHNIEILLWQPYCCQTVKRDTMLQITEDIKNYRRILQSGKIADLHQA